MINVELDQDMAPTTVGRTDREPAVLSARMTQFLSELKLPAASRGSANISRGAAGPGA